MNCHKHEEKSASSICMFCGKGICLDCLVTSQHGRLVCSIECEKKLELIDDAIMLTKSKTVNQNLYAGYFMIMLGIIFVLCAVLSIPSLGFSFLLTFLCAAGIAFFIGGYWALKVAKKRKSDMQVYLLDNNA